MVSSSQKDYRLFLHLTPTEKIINAASPTTTTTTTTTSAMANQQTHVEALFQSTHNTNISSRQPSCFSNVFKVYIRCPSLHKYHILLNPLLLMDHHPSLPLMKLQRPMESECSSRCKQEDDNDQEKSNGSPVHGSISTESYRRRYFGGDCDIGARTEGQR